MKKPAAATTPNKQQKAGSAPTKADKKGAAATPVKTEAKQGAKPAAAADKPLNKTQLFINSIKESVSVSELKSLYPKAKTVKMQKRKVGPNHKVVQ